MQLILMCLIAYLIGAVPFGYLIARWRGVDILKQGSGNIGATNVGRVLGKRFGLLVFVLDFLKGAGPTFAAPWLSELFGAASDINLVRVAAGLAAFLGHIFPVFLKFRGGKGVATGAGVVAVLLFAPALAALLTWITLLCAYRYVSLASVAAALVLCVLRLVTTRAPFARDNYVLTLFCFVAAGLVILRHRSNIVCLWRGTENRLRESTAMSQLTKIIHVLAIGLWFGSAAFFILVAAPAIFFQGYEPLAKPEAARPAWFPESFDKEKADQLAGIAVAPIFPQFFLLQGACGFLAVATALAWTRLPHRVHRLRFAVLALAWLTALAGWPLAQKVSSLRLLRYGPDTAAAAAAKTDFATWHLYSLGLSCVTLLLVALGMALAASLPCSKKEVVES